MSNKEIYKSDLRLTGECYRTTPDKWGAKCIMIDEDEARELMKKSFACDEIDPDEDQNDLPEWVQIAEHGDGRFFAVSSDDEGAYLIDDPDHDDESGLLLTYGYYRFYHEPERVGFTIAAGEGENTGMVRITGCAGQSTGSEWMTPEDCLSVILADDLTNDNDDDGRLLAAIRAITPGGANTLTLNRQMWRA